LGLLKPNEEDSEDWPKSVDLVFAAHALHNILETHRLPHELVAFSKCTIEFAFIALYLLPFQLAPLLGQETTSPPQLTAMQAAQIGLQFMFAQPFAALNWIIFAIRKVTEEGDRSIPLSSLEGYLEHALELVRPLLSDYLNADLNF